MQKTGVLIGFIDLREVPVYGRVGSHYEGSDDMKFVKLHQEGREILVNMSTVSDIYRLTNDKSVLYLNFEVGGDQVQLRVDETLEQRYEKVKGE